ncbi:MAG TPA: TetR/AcrR family transcriptional regulator [Acidimicrobiales bacterium]|nr:TetR/AcrR family transcriptional regulator [Acidimicrobiales bacterium]
MTKQARSLPVMQSVLDAVAERLMAGDESRIRIPEICEATGVNYGSVYHHFGSREGVLDAAYEMLFTRLTTDDLEGVRIATEDSETFDEYLSAVIPIVTSVSSGDERRRRRAMRLRVVAAASAREELRVLIARAQTEASATLSDVVRFGQQRGWVRRDVDAHFLAVLLQILLFGRVVDDISLNPVSDELWEHSASVLFFSLLTPPED